MPLEITSEWKTVFKRDTERQFAETNDPRVLAVIERDDACNADQAFDGDCYAPAFLWDRRAEGIEEIGKTYMDPESKEIAGRISEARTRFRYKRLPNTTISRFARIFYETDFEVASSQDMQVVIFSTPSWREHVGLAEMTDERTTLVDTIRGDVEEWQNYLDGEVYGVGWAVRPAQVMKPEDEIDLSDYEVTIECWRFIGEEYARESAASFEHGQPEDLEELLDFS